tara:strand:+ start:7454 stop:10738 length:3285 start_codon:yes stop_codon:yes gene_type:complete
MLASHGAGFDITYECVNQGATSDEYKIILKYYRDCSSSSTANSTFSLQYSSSCGSGFASIPQVSGPTFITPLCPGAADTCLNTGFVELEEYIYEKNIILTHCSDWVISVCANGNRNGAINTIINPTNQELCVEAEINNTNICNSSPTFSEYPVPYICVNQTYCYNNGAIDLEGDSLVYSLVTPLNNSGGVSYAPGFSPSSPIVGTTVFDALTGDLCLSPSQVNVSVIAMKITEYRNGIKIGSVIRDIQIIILNCSTTPPILTGFNNTPQNVTNASALDDSLHFCVTGTDAINFPISAQLGSSMNKNMYWSGISGIPSASFSVSNNFSNNPTGIFNWTPQYLDVSNSPYTFTVTVEDDACPVNNIFSYTYTVTLSSALDFDIIVDTTSPSCVNYNDGKIDLIIAGTTGSTSYTWSGPNGFQSIDQNIDSLYEGDYFLTITDQAGCVKLDTIEIVDPLSLNIYVLMDSVSCIGNNDGAIDITISGNTTNFTYNWSAPNGFSSSAEDINSLFSGIYSLSVIDNNGCIFDTSFTLPPPNPFNTIFLVDSITCNGGNDGSIDLIVTSNNNNLTYNWTGPNNFSSTNQNINSLSSGTYQITITDANNCIFIDTVILEDPNQIIYIDTIVSCDQYQWNGQIYTVTGNYTFNTISVNGCDSTVILELNIYESNDTTQTIVSCDQYEWNGQIYNSSGNYNYSTLNAYGCDSIVILDLTINETTSFNYSIKECNPYLWNGITYDSSGIYTYKTINSLGCDSIVTIDLQITSYEINVETPICYLDSSNLLINIIEPASNNYMVTINNLNSSYNYNIDSSGLLFNNTIINLSPDSTTEYILVSIIDDNNCESFLNEEITVVVNPLPLIDILLNEVCINEPYFPLDFAYPKGGVYFINNEQIDVFNPSNIGLGQHILRYDYVDSITNCSNQKEQEIIIRPKPISDFYCDYYTVKQDTPIQFFSNSSDYTSLYWIVDSDVLINDSIIFSYTYVDTGVYDVQLITLNDYNCLDTFINQITILPSYVIHIPTAFTPNGDGRNDVFNPEGEGIKEYKIKIYNRWGEEVFNGEKNTPWKGLGFPDGEYSYVIDIINLRDQSYQYVYHVLLMK